MISGIILAGGQGKRLGHDKASLEIAGEPLLRRVTRSLQSLTNDIVIVGGDATDRRHLVEGLEGAALVSFIPDLFPGKGSLGGIYSGLQHSRSFYSIAVACDMPFLNVELLGYMVEQADGYDVIVPRIGSYLEPIHAVYSKNCLEAMARLLQQDNLRIIDFFSEAKVRYVDESEIDRFDPDRLSIFNINTPEDLEIARKLAKIENRVT